MTVELTSMELATLLKTKAGVTVDPLDLDRPGATFEEFGVDSLGLLAVVGELENRHGLSMTSAESCTVLHRIPERRQPLPEDRGLRCPGTPRTPS